MSGGPFVLDGKTALVTGAAGGIGRAIALCLAERGCNLALVDIDQPGLAQTGELALGVHATKAGAGGLTISLHHADLAQPADIAALPAAVQARHPGVDLLVNNAGVALAGGFEAVDSHDFEWLLAINLLGVVRMSKAFLPLLRAAPEARLVNVSSLFGLIAPPGQTAYSTSKFAVNGFSQALAHELAGSSVGVSIVYPGGVATGIGRNARGQDGLSAQEAAQRRARLDRLLKMAPERAGQIIVDGIQARRARILVGRDAKIASFVARLAPASYWRLLKGAT
jgi:NAD(P)-dependent dehydrogenase (short-subunit alcohol dehydrogenase family)